MRSRGKLNEAFGELSKKVWEAFAAPHRKSFGQRMRRLWEWAQANVKGAWLLEQVEKVCKRKQEYGLAYAHPGGHRTSNMLDRVMRGMSRYFDDCQHLHGSAAACERHCRAWALLFNYRPWHLATARQRGLEESGREAQQAPLPPRLAPEPPRVRFPWRLPSLKPPAPQSMTARNNDQFDSVRNGRTPARKSTRHMPLSHNASPLRLASCFAHGCPRPTFPFG